MRYYELDTVMTREQCIAFQKRIVALGFPKDSYYITINLIKDVRVSQDELERYINGYLTSFTKLEQVLEWLTIHESAYLTYYNELGMTNNYYDINKIEQNKKG